MNAPNKQATDNKSRTTMSAMILRSHYCRNNHQANRDNVDLEFDPLPKQRRISYQSGREDSGLDDNHGLSVYENAQPETRRCNSKRQWASCVSAEDADDEPASYAPIPEDISSYQPSFRERTIGRAPLVMKKFIR